VNAASDNVLVPGRTCWRIEPAARFALIVDAADYFHYAKAAMLNARRRIMLIGWDFDVRIRLEPDRKTLEGPNRLGDFLAWLPEHRPELDIYVLKWDLGVVQALGRGMAPIIIRNWTTSDRLRFKLDGVHPPGAAHHQKIVSIDDAFAFCGGIDITVDRWDTREHPDDHPCRREPNGEPYGPWHDATTALDGRAALAIAELARERWRQATDERLEPVHGSSDPWPDGLAPTVEHVQVGIARTFPELDGREAVTEIEHLYLAAIARARRTIYLESQYFASRKLADALAARLREPDGPEVVLILPEKAEGWLEQSTMDGARVLLLRMLWDADEHRRFGAFYPVTERGASIYVHAKIMVIDDVLLRVGSSNLNNRSLSFDTECDLALEASPDAPGDRRLRTTIRQIRDGLLCEHLAVEPEALDAALSSAGSLPAAIGKLQGSGRTLRRFDPEDVAGDESPLAENELLDPEQRSLGTLQRLRGGFRDLVAGFAARRRGAR
jgi:phosphatidylserine/phosphatidylglycerophosphate/cardiolipin synthase-like enzyme